MADRGFVGVFAALVLTVVVIASVFRKGNGATPIPITPDAPPVVGGGVVYESTASNGTTFAVNEVATDQNKLVYEVGTVSAGSFSVLTGSSISRIAFTTFDEAKTTVDNLVAEVDNTDPSSGPVSEPSSQPSKPPTFEPRPSDPLDPFPSGFGAGGL